jgi:succinate dehydrogenase / fumarate reductase iron-sulfur subunit
VGTELKTISVQLQIKRTNKWQDYQIVVPQDAYVLDALEAAGNQDKSLLFRHACHHASCGSCGIRINGRECLPCITPLAKFKNSYGKLRLEPLRNFPLIDDLLVDFRPFMNHMDLIDMPLRRGARDKVNKQIAGSGIEYIQPPEDNDVPAFATGFNRLENCIECGLCMSACPVVGSDSRYLGPAILAAAGRIMTEPRGRSVMEVLKQVDHDHGLWRCHGAFECTEVCPAGVDPAREIMSMRRHLLPRLSTIKADKET